MSPNRCKASVRASLAPLVPFPITTSEHHGCVQAEPSFAPIHLPLASFSSRLLSLKLVSLASKYFTSGLAPCHILSSFHPPLYSLLSSHLLISSYLSLSGPLLLCLPQLRLSYFILSFLLLSYLTLSSLILFPVSNSTAPPRGPQFRLRSQVIGNWLQDGA